MKLRPTGLRAAVYAGSFDPFTNGHYEMIRRGLVLFDNSGSHKLHSSVWEKVTRKSPR